MDTYMPNKYTWKNSPKVDFFIIENFPLLSNLFVVLDAIQYSWLNSLKEILI